MQQTVFDLTCVDCVKLLHCCATTQTRAVTGQSGGFLLPLEDYPNCVPPQRPRSETADEPADTYTGRDDHGNIRADPQLIRTQMALFLSGVRGRFLCASNKESAPEAFAIWRKSLLTFHSESVIITAQQLHTAKTVKERVARKERHSELRRVGTGRGAFG